jgi:hypothetical protein
MNCASNRACLRSVGFYFVAKRRDVKPTEMDTSTLNLNSAWVSRNFLTTVALRSRGVSNTDEWKDNGNILVWEVM